MNIGEKLINHDKELLSRAKFPSELVREVSGFVHSITGYTKAMSHTPRNEIIIGGNSPKYETGYQNQLILEISPYGEAPVKTITFRGNSPIITSQEISAGIFVGKEESLLGEHKDERIISRGMGGLAGYTYHVFVERPLEENEEAIYLKLLNEGRSEIRIDYSVDYDPKFHE